MDASFWNSRYAAIEFAYGEEPNLYFKEKVSMLSAGNALFPAEGEGRNAVYAAQLGWNVSAFDPSMSGKEKALRLAANRKVTINYDVRFGRLLFHTFSECRAYTLARTISSNY